MKKNLFNILVDTLSLVVFMLMISTGLLLKFILPPGSGRVEKLLAMKGKGHQVIDLFMGFSRHEWGEVHFYISLLFLGLLIVHLILHWNWIKATIFGSKLSPTPYKRKIIAVGVLTFVILSVLFPWIAPKQTVDRTEYLEMKEG